MSLSLGHLVGYLELDDKKFNRSAAAADRKMTALQLHLKALAATNPKIQVDVETKKLDDLKARMADLKAQAAKGVDVRVEIAQALIDIDRVQLKLRELHNKEVRIKVDGDSALQTIGKVGSKINGLWTTILGLGPMLIPVGAAATGSILAIGSASIQAAVGVGVLAAAFAGIGKSTQALSTYREAVKSAGPKAKIQASQLALGVATAQHAYAKHPTAINARRLDIARQKQAQGPASLASAKAALDKSGYEDQSRAGQRFVKFTLDKLAPATHSLHNTAQSAVLPGVERGLKSLLPMLPVFTKLIDRVGLSIGAMAARAGKALNDPFWQHFFSWLTVTAGPALMVMGHSWGQLFEGIARTLQHFGPQGHSLIMWVDDLTTRFNMWSRGGAGSGFQAFMDYIRQSGPAVVGVLKPLGQIIGHLLVGMGSTGLGELHVFGVLLDGIAHLPTGAIETIGVVLPGIILALKGMQFINALSVGITGLGKSFGFMAAEAEGAAATGALGGGLRGRAGRAVGAAGLAFAGLSIASSASNGPGKWSGAAQRIGGDALTGAVAGGVAASVIPIPFISTGVGAGIGATVGALAGLWKQLHRVNSETKTTDTSWQDYMSTLNGTKAAVTSASRQLAYLNLQKSGALAAIEKLGLSDHTAVQAATGNKSARKALGVALAHEEATHAAGLTDAEIKSIYDGTQAVGKARLEQLKMNLAIAETRKQISAAWTALHEFHLANGTAKVGLTGYQQTMQQLRMLKAYMDSITGNKPSAPLATDPSSILGGTPTPRPRRHGGPPIVGARALGGPVTAGLTYKINERGLETFFTPSRNGTILDAHGTQDMLRRGSGVTLDEIRDLFYGQRPLYGDVHINGDPTTFKRQLEQDRALAGLGGRRPR